MLFLENVTLVIIVIIFVVDVFFSNSVCVVNKKASFGQLPAHSDTKVRILTYSLNGAY